MRAAPAVRALLDDSRPERVLIAGLYGSAAAVVVVWALAHAGVRLPMQVSLLAAAAALVAAALGWRIARATLPADAQSLDWTGQAWGLTGRRLGDMTQSGATIPLRTVLVALDLGAWQLLHLQTHSGGWRWQVLRAASVGPDWHGLRLALRFHGGNHGAAPPAVQPAPQQADRVNTP